MVETTGARTISGSSDSLPLAFCAREILSSSARRFRAIAADSASTFGIGGGVEGFEQATMVRGVKVCKSASANTLNTFLGLNVDCVECDGFAGRERQLF